MPELSIIVPVYKVEEYLERCIKSILSQTFKDFELILIDDGSPDKCGKICDEWARKDDRIVVIHQQNKGVSAARNAGLEVAKGKYISFPDSDDFLEREMFEKMISIMQRNEADVAICGVNYCDEEGNIIRSDLIEQNAYNHEQLMFSIFGMPNPLGGACWNKIFRCEIIENVKFVEKMKFAEDWMFLFDSFIYCNLGVQIDKALYNVVERKGSTTRSNEIDAMYRIILGSKIMVDKAHRYSTELENQAVDKFLDNCVRYTSLMNIEAKKKKESFRKKKYHIKWLMLKELGRAKANNILSNNKLRGYFFEMLKL